MNIKIWNGHEYLSDNFFLFPAGEVGIKLDSKNYQFFHCNSKPFTIYAQTQNSNDLFRIAFVKDALERIIGYDKPINLFIPYLPYARQDRVCIIGESFSLKVICNYINHLNFDQVTIVDPHSLVSESLIDRLKIISQFEIFHNWQELKRKVMEGGIFCSVDAGSNKKTSEIAGYFGHKIFVRCDKLRDLSNGQIKETVVYADDLENQTIFVPDDLIDGGKSFIELAKVLKNKNAGDIILYATHLVLSKGVKLLLESGITEIWGTNSYREQPEGYYPEDKVKILKLEEVFKL